MEIQRVIDSKVDEKFNVIEDKLRNSFQAIKKDNDLIKSKIAELGALVEKSSTNKVLVEMDKLRANTLIDINQIKENVKKGLDDFSQKDITPLRKEVKDLRNEINKKNLKEDIKNQLRKEIFAEFEKKIDKRFEKFENKASDMKEDVAEYKKSTFKRFEDSFNSFEESSRKLKEDLEATNEGFVKKVRSDSSSLKRDFSAWKKYFDERIEKELSKDNERVAMIERQITYLKGRVNSLSKVKPVVVKKSDDKSSIESIFGKLMEGFSKDDVVIKKQIIKQEKPIYVKPVKIVPIKVEAKKPETKRDKTRGFFSSIIDSLADDVSKEQKKQNKEQKKVVKIKNVKKLEQDSEKNFMNRIINSLADD